MNGFQDKCKNRAIENVCGNPCDAGVFFKAGGLYVHFFGKNRCGLGEYAIPNFR